MVSCKLCKCSRGTRFSLEHNVMFHKFPANPNIKKKWMEFIATQLYGFNIEQRTVIYLCSLHFDQNCYLKSDTGQLHLKKNSIPTIPFTYHDREVHNKSRYSNTEKQQSSPPELPASDIVPQFNEEIINSLPDDVPDSSLQFNQSEFDLGAQILNLSDKIEDLTKRTDSVKSLRAKINFLKRKVAKKDHEIRFWKRKCARMRGKSMALDKGNKTPSAVSIFIVNKT